MVVYRSFTSPRINFARTHLYKSPRVGRGAMKVKCLVQEHNAVPWPRLEPGPIDLESSALTIRPPRHPYCYYDFFFNLVVPFVLSQLQCLGEPCKCRVLVLFRVKSRCKHYMIDQTRSGKFVIVGMPQVYKSLKEMVNVHKKVQGTVQSCVCFLAPG